MSVCPEATTSVPSSIFGCSTFIAPLKNTAELASSGEPEKSSMFHGASWPERAASPSRSAWPCSSPTLKLSNAT